MSFVWQNDATTIVDALSQGMTQFGDATFDGDWSTAVALLGDNFAGLEDHMAQQIFVQLSGTLDGAGAATILHNIGAPFATVLVQAFYKGATAADAVPCPVSAVSSTAVTVAADVAGAGQPCRVTLVYSTTPPGW